MEVQLPPHESTFCSALWVPENSKQERGEGRVWWGGEGGYHLLGSHLGEGDTQKGRKGGSGAVCVQTRACVARAQKAGGGEGRQCRGPVEQGHGIVGRALGGCAAGGLT